MILCYYSTNSVTIMDRKEKEKGGQHKERSRPPNS